MKQLHQSFEEKAEQYSINSQIESFDYSINISLQYNYLYTETPKVACSTIKTILQKMELGNPDLYRPNFEDIHDREISPLLRPSQVEPLDLFLQGDRLYKFCFSRNPYTRLLSAFLDKIENNRPEKRPILQALGKDPSLMEQVISFKEFIQVICEQTTINMNTHWKVQYYQTFQSNIRYDYIGKIENFNKDINIILSRINPDYRNYISSEKRHATNANFLLNKHYTPSIIAKVKDKYKLDFEFFGYDEKLPKL